MTSGDRGAVQQVSGRFWKARISAVDTVRGPDHIAMRVARSAAAAWFTG